MNGLDSYSPSHDDDNPTIDGNTTFNVINGNVEDEEDYEPSDSYVLPENLFPASISNGHIYDHFSNDDGLDTVKNAQPVVSKPFKTRAGFVMDDDSDEDNGTLPVKCVAPETSIVQPDPDIPLITVNDDTPQDFACSASKTVISLPDTESDVTLLQSESTFNVDTLPSNTTSESGTKSISAESEPASTSTQESNTPIVGTHPSVYDYVSGVLPTSLPSVSTEESNSNEAVNSVPEPSVGENPPEHVTSYTETSLPSISESTNLPKARLPNDIVGILEDRIADDPRGDVDAWLNLVNEYQRRNKIDEARKVYERFFKVFPSSASMWVNYVNMELGENNFVQVEQIFARSLINVPNVAFWSTYLDYIRRRNNINTDTTGTARQVISQAYEFVLENVGCDQESGQLWLDYIQFISTGPGNLGNSGWQDQQKMDLLRKTYRRAVCIPTEAICTLWKDYDNFEMELNKLTGRKFLQEKSATYMTARSCNIAMQNVLNGLIRSTIPKLPPLKGYEGYTEYMEQVQLWKKWIEWEKNDPLVVKDEDIQRYRSRVLYVFKQALMALRFWPEIWYNAAEFCFENDMELEGHKFLDEGMAANPENCLLAFKKAEQVEMWATGDDSEESMIRRGEMIREPYEKCLDALYALISKHKKKESQAVMLLKENFAKQERFDCQTNEDSEDMPSATTTGFSHEAVLKSSTVAVQKFYSEQISMVSKTLSHVWIALMRAMRRVQGKGKVGDKIGGSRQVFTDARKRGRLTSDVYIASALMEFHCYKDPAATKIFERGMKLFPDDEEFSLEYLKHLIAINDTTNARAVFETTVARLIQKPEAVEKSKAIFQFFHEYESKYGELKQIFGLEQRMKDLFPDDPQLQRFSRRFDSAKFDVTQVQLILSPATQTQRKNLSLLDTTKIYSPTDSVESKSSQRGPNVISGNHRVGESGSSGIQKDYGISTYSPKRLYSDADIDDNSGQMRKMARHERGESPLKGAAGRKMELQRRAIASCRGENNSTGGYQSGNTTSWRSNISGSGGTVGNIVETLPSQVMFLLGIIPGAEKYLAAQSGPNGWAASFDPKKMLELLKSVDLNRADTEYRRR